MPHSPAAALDGTTPDSTLAPAAAAAVANAPGEGGVAAVPGAAGRRRAKSPRGPRLPATGVVLIGTPATVRTLAAQLAALPDSCIPAGCVLLGRFDDRRGAAGGQAGARGTGGGDGFGGILPPVLGYVDELIGVQAQYQFKLALVSVPRTHADRLPGLRRLLAKLEIPARIIPTFEQLLAGEPAARADRGVSPEAIDPVALIGRTHSGLDRKAVGRILRGKRVLITGAGGSIGSQLAQVVAGFEPEAVLLMERAENALFEIDHRIARRFPGVARRAVLHDVVDAEQTRRLLAELRPHAVFHAAAHKHVPLMEDHPSHALGNNLFGTRSIADAALAAGAERFVMISTDKAVNPTSVMGATKRLAELYVSSLAGRGVGGAGGTGGTGGTGGAGTRFSMVRFGNVLASACSVIPIWAQQLAEGGPLTVTDPRMTRYFMTIPEAATLVVQAAALDQPPSAAPVYVLDMGEPLRILDLAVRFARLNGYEPRIDLGTIPGPAQGAALALPDPEDGPDAAEVPLVFTGARPGEKLFEQLAYAAENLQPTAHPAINQWSASGEAPDAARTQRMIDDLASLCRPGADKQAVVAAIRRHCPEMTPPPAA